MPKIDKTTQQVNRIKLLIYSNNSNEFKFEQILSSVCYITRELSNEAHEIAENYETALPENRLTFSQWWYKTFNKYFKVST